MISVYLNVFILIISYDFDFKLILEASLIMNYVSRKRYWKATF